MHGARFVGLCVALQVAGDPNLHAQAAAEFESCALANTTKPTYDVQIKAIVKIAEAAKFPLLPTTRGTVAVIGGTVKAANFKSANSCLARYNRAHVEAG